MYLIKKLKQCGSKQNNPQLLMDWIGPVVNQGKKKKK